MHRSTGLTLTAILLTAGGVMAQQVVSSGPAEPKTAAADAVARFGDSQSKLVIPQAWPYAKQPTDSTAQPLAPAMPKPKPGPQSVSGKVGTAAVGESMQIRPRSTITTRSAQPIAVDKAIPRQSGMPVVPEPWPFNATNQDDSVIRESNSNLPATVQQTTARQATVVADFSNPVSKRSTQRAEAAEWWNQPGPVPEPQPLDAEGPTVAGPVEAPVVQPPPFDHQPASARPDVRERSTKQYKSQIDREARPIAIARRRQRGVARNRASLSVISRHANEHVRYGFDLAEKGAVHSARGEFVEALSIIADALDVEGDKSYRTALIAGLRSLDEANDFARQGEPLEASVNFHRLRDVHKTPLLADADLQTLSPYVAMQLYFAYAEKQLTFAGGGIPAASRALYGLGRIQPFLAGQDGPGNRLAGPKGIALHRAALSTDPRNHQAANELGVQLARYGQMTAAIGAFKQSLSVHPVPEAWHNLARVYEQQGDETGARLARSQHESLIAAARHGDTNSIGGSAIRWVDPADFAPTSGGRDVAQRTDSAQRPSSNSKVRPAATKSAGPIQRIGRLFGRNPRR